MSESAMRWALEPLGNYWTLLCRSRETETGDANAADPELVEVVRCRDCQYEESRTEEDWELVGDNKPETTYWCGRGMHCCYGEHDRNWYCADGKRREEKP